MFVELHARTNFSFLEGASHAHELFQRASELEYRALAVTDRNTLSGIVRAHTAAKNHGIKLIIGADLDLKGSSSPLTLIAQDRQGYGNLCRLTSCIARRKGQEHPDLSPEELSVHSQGLFAFHSSPYSKNLLCTLKEIFGEKLSIFLRRTLEPSDIRRTLEAFELYRDLQIPIAATNDVHYHTPQRQALQDILTCIRHGTSLDKAGHLLFPNGERYLKSPDQMTHLFRDRPDALTRTLEIEESCHFSLDELRYLYPNEFLPEGKTSITHLRDLVKEGTEKTYGAQVPKKVHSQLEHELKLIEELHFEDYFLTIHDIVLFARSRGILCQGRGSAANSVVCYVLGITAIDPVQMNLLFERFISAERGEPPDIDVDFEHERREEVIQYIYRRYGRERAGMVAEVISYRPKSALRDVAKALGMEHRVAVKLSKSFHRRDHGSSHADFLKAQGIDPEGSLGQKILRFTEEILRFPRHLGTHVGGFVLTQNALIESVPIEKAGMPGRTIIQWDKNDLDALQMLKIDVLGLGMLTVIRKCLEYVNENTPSHSEEREDRLRIEAFAENSPQCGRRPDEDCSEARNKESQGIGHSTVQKLELHTIPHEDPLVYQMIQKADTIGVFQIESRAQMGMLPRLKPKTFYDLVIEVAIVRPGPIQGGMVHPFLRRKRGEEKVRYPHPALKEILHKTYGVPLFQEQVMKMAVAVADFTPGEADQLRRAMGIWRTANSGSMHELAEKLIRRMIKNGIPKKDAMTIFKQIKSFGEFGFPESHSASFALLAYASSYLKCYYPAAFACALINSQPMGFYSPHSILQDAKRHHVKVLPIDVSYSDWYSTLEHHALRLGLHFVFHLSEKSGKRIHEERERRPFGSMEDFVSRTRLNRLELFYLAISDAFQSFGYNRREAIWKLEALSSTRSDLFSGKTTETIHVSFPDLTPFRKVVTDHRSTGVSLQGHPVEFLRESMNSLGAIPNERLLQTQDGHWVSVGGMVIVRQSPPTAKGMVFLTLEDETGFVNVAVPPKAYERMRSVLTTEAFLLFRGKLQRDGFALSVLAKNVVPLQFEEPQSLPTRSRDFH